jgi:hypothetical protein
MVASWGRKAHAISQTPAGSMATLALDIIIVHCVADMRAWGGPCKRCMRVHAVHAVHTATPGQPVRRVNCP